MPAPENFPTWGMIRKSNEFLEMSHDQQLQVNRNYHEALKEYYPDEAEYIDESSSKWGNEITSLYPDYQKDEDRYELKSKKIKDGTSLIDIWDKSLEGNTKKGEVDLGVDGTFTEAPGMVRNDEAFEAREKRDAILKEMGLTFEEGETLVEDAKRHLWISDQTGGKNAIMDSDGMISVNPKKALLPEDVKALKEEVESLDALDKEKEAALKRVDNLHEVQKKELINRIKELDKETKEMYKSAAPTKYHKWLVDKLGGMAEWEIGASKDFNDALREGKSEEEALFSVIRSQDTKLGSAKSAMQADSTSMEAIPESVKFIFNGERSAKSKYLAKRQALESELRSGVSGANSLIFDLTRGGAQVGRQLLVTGVTGGVGGVALGAATAGIESASGTIQELSNDQKLLSMVKSGEITEEEYADRVRGSGLRVGAVTAGTTLMFNKGVEALGSSLVRKNISKKLTSELVEEIGRTKDPVVKRVIKGFVGGGTEETFEEALQGAHQFIEVSKAKGEDPDWSEFATDLPRTALVSFMLGGGVNSVVSGIDANGFNPDVAKNAILELQSRARSGEDIFMENAGEGGIAEFINDPLGDKSVKAFAKANNISEEVARSRIASAMKEGEEAMREANLDTKTPIDQVKNIGLPKEESPVFTGEALQNLGVKEREAALREKGRDVEPSEDIAKLGIENVGEARVELDLITDDSGNPLSGVPQEKVDSLNEYIRQSEDTPSGDGVKGIEPDEDAIKPDAIPIEEVRDERGGSDGDLGEPQGIVEDRAEEEVVGESLDPETLESVDTESEIETIPLDDIQQGDTREVGRVGETTDGSSEATTDEVGVIQPEAEEQIQEDQAGVGGGGTDVEENLPEPTPLDAYNRGKIPGQHYKAPESSIVIQVRGLDSTPLKDGLYSFGFDGTKEDAIRVIAQNFDVISNKHPEMSQRESVFSVTDNNGNTIALIDPDRVHDKVSIKPYSEIVKLRGGNPKDSLLKKEGAFFNASGNLKRQRENIKTKENRNNKEVVPTRKASSIKEGDSLKIDKGGKTPTNEKVKTITDNGDGTVTIGFTSPTSITIGKDQEIGDIISTRSDYSGVPTETVIETANDVYKGFKKFKSWSREMVKRIGEKIRPKLKEIWNALKEAGWNLTTKALEKTGGISYVVDPNEGIGQQRDEISGRITESKMMSSFEKATNRGDFSEEEFNTLIDENVFKYEKGSLNAWRGKALNALRMYAKESDGDSLDIKNGVDGAYNALYSKMVKGEILSPVEVATSIYVMKQLSERGDSIRLVEMASEIRAQGTLLGQTIKAFDFMRLLTPEGKLRAISKGLAKKARRKNKGKDRKNAKKIEDEIKKVDDSNVDKRKESIIKRLKYLKFSDEQIKYYGQLITDLTNGVDLNTALERFNNEIDIDPELAKGIEKWLDESKDSKGVFLIEQERAIVEVIEYANEIGYLSNFGDIFQARVLSLRSGLKAIYGNTASKLMRGLALSLDAIITRDVNKLAIELYGLGKGITGSLDKIMAIRHDLPQDSIDEYFGGRDTVFNDFKKAKRIFNDPDSSIKNKFKAVGWMIYTSDFINFKALTAIDVPFREATTESEALISQYERERGELLSKGMSKKEAKDKAIKRVRESRVKLSKESLDEYIDLARKEYEGLSKGAKLTKRDEVLIRIRALEMQTEDNIDPNDYEQGVQASNEISMTGRPPGKWGDVADGIIKIRNSISKMVSDVTGKDVGTGKLIMPFPNVGINALRLSLDTAGLGFLPAIRRNGYDHLTPDQKRNAYYRALAGWSMTAVVMGLADVFDDEEGDIFIDLHGAGPSDKKLRDKWKQEKGWSPYSIEVKVAGGKSKYLSYGLTPLVFILGTAGNYRDNFKYKDKDVETLDYIAFRASAMFTEIAGMRHYKNYQPEEGFFKNMILNPLLDKPLIIASPQFGNRNFIDGIMNPNSKDFFHPDEKIQKIPFAKELANKFSKKNEIEDKYVYDYKGEVVKRPLQNRILGSIYQTEIKDIRDDVEKHLNDNGIYSYGFRRPPKGGEVGDSRIKFMEEPIGAYIDSNGNSRVRDESQSSRYEISWRKKAQEFKEKFKDELLSKDGIELERANNLIVNKAKLYTKAEELIPYGVEASDLSKIEDFTLE